MLKFIKTVLWGQERAEKLKDIGAPLLEKHRRLINCVCCPQCRGEVVINNSLLVDNIPLWGRILCARCSEIGNVANLKFYFNSYGQQLEKIAPGVISGAIRIKERPLEKEQFLSQDCWSHTDSGGFYSEKSGAKFILQTSALSVGISLLKHPWSGRARILIDGHEAFDIDLYEREGSLRIWKPIYLGEGDHTIELENVSDKNANSISTQVWILGVDELVVSSREPTSIFFPVRNDGNPYPSKFNQLIATVPQDGLVLDCGSGDRRFPDSRVINFEYSHFRSPDVFGDGHCLPFKNNSFDLILSQAVIEHLHDPFLAVSEIFRVLKPRGIVYCESAFMQPLHAVPYHFFNTTIWGIERLFKDFNIVEVSYEGVLSQSLAWYYSLTGLRNRGYGDKLDQLLELARELDNYITRDELKHFASYITLLAKKPEMQQ